MCLPGSPAAPRDCQNLPAFASINFFFAFTALAFLHDEHRIKYTLIEVRLNVERNATHRCGVWARCCWPGSPVASIPAQLTCSRSNAHASQVA